MKFKGKQICFAYFTSFVSFHPFTQASSENPHVIHHGVCVEKSLRFGVLIFWFFMSSRKLFSWRTLSGGYPRNG